MGYRWISALILLLAPLAQASLGGGLGTIALDRNSFQTSIYTTKNLSSFSVHEMGNDAIRVREYAATGGTVFAVTWRGTNTPDLRPLLGSYFADFMNAARNTKRGPWHIRAPHRLVQGAEVTVETWGHLGAIGGRAFVPRLMPTGVSLNDIR